jgi:hypothetical protein
MYTRLVIKPYNLDDNEPIEIGLTYPFYIEKCVGDNDSDTLYAIAAFIPVKEQALENTCWVRLMTQCYKRHVEIDLPCVNEGEDPCLVWFMSPDLDNLLTLVDTQFDESWSLHRDRSPDEAEAARIGYTITPNKPSVDADNLDYVLYTIANNLRLMVSCVKRTKTGSMDVDTLMYTIEEACSEIMGMIEKP